MKTFNVTKTNNPVLFSVNGEEFEALSAENCSAEIIADYFQGINEGNLFKTHDLFFKSVLTKDSYNRFNIRLYSKENPITISVLGDVTAWLIGDEYLGGKSYGRSQAVISFAHEYWDEFDSWCLIHGIKESPWKLPSYRFGALVVAYMKFDKIQEGLEKIDEALEDADQLPQAFLDPSFRRVVQVMGSILSNETLKETLSTRVDNVIYDSRLVNDLPVEERKRQEARAAGKPFRVPEWWRGEKANYKIAKNMMGTLPKKMGPVKDK